VRHSLDTFAPIARTVIVTDAGELSTPEISKCRYKNLRRPVLPLDPEEACI